MSAAASEPEPEPVRLARPTSVRYWVGDVDDWSAELRGRGLSASTLRAYQGHLRQFCDYLVDPRYEWGQLCWKRFGTHPVQVCHEWNTTAHVARWRLARRSGR